MGLGLVWPQRPIQKKKGFKGFLGFKKSWKTEFPPESLGYPLRILEKTAISDRFG